jgi:hypothetical protein
MSILSPNILKFIRSEKAIFEVDTRRAGAVATSFQSKPSPTVRSKKDARLTINELRGGQVSRKTNDHHSEEGFSKRVVLKNTCKYATARDSSTNAEQTHGSPRCTKKSSFEAVIEATLEEDMDITVEPNLGAGSSSKTTDTLATDDGLFRNAECKYLEVDQAVYEEELELRGTLTGSHMPEPVRDGLESADDEVEEVHRKHSSSPSPATKHQSRGRKLSRSPPLDKQGCCSTLSTTRPAWESFKKSSNNIASSKDRHHSLLADR